MSSSVSGSGTDRARRGWEQKLLLRRHCRPPLPAPEIVNLRPALRALPVLALAGLLALQTVSAGAMPYQGCAGFGSAGMGPAHGGGTPPSVDNTAQHERYTGHCASCALCHSPAADQRLSEPAMPAPHRAPGATDAITQSLASEPLHRPPRFAA